MDYLVEDSSFLLSLLNPKDPFHSAAILTLQILRDISSLTLVFPEIVIYETSFVLMRNGIAPEIIRTKINNLSMIPKVIIFNSDPLTALRYISRHYNQLTLSQNSRNITKTNDYLIACAAKDFDAIVLSSDNQMIETLNNLGVKCYNFSKEADRIKLKNQFTNIPF